MLSSWLQMKMVPGSVSVQPYLLIQDLSWLSARKEKWIKAVAMGQGVCQSGDQWSPRVTMANVAKLSLAHNRSVPKLRWIRDGSKTNPRPV